MSFYVRWRPHWTKPNAPLFLTWRLANSTPIRHLRPLIGVDDWDDAFARQGDRWMEDPRIAAIVDTELRRQEGYSLDAYVVMPNHVHLICRMNRDDDSALPELNRRWKGRTSITANRLLNRTGRPFWEAQWFDRWMRNDDELNRTIRYIESNPVKAGLVPQAEDWPWSSASRTNPLTRTTTIDGL